MPLAKLSDLKPDPRNPRQITAEEAEALRESLTEFGDLSGITWNAQTGQLVCGHQRLEQIRAKYGDLEIAADGTINTPDGHSFTVRVVDWPYAKQQAANLAANSELLAGSFVNEQVDQIIAELSQDNQDLIERLRLDELVSLEDLADTSDEETQLVSFKPQAPPAMTWVLVGIPTVRYGEIAQLVEQLSEIPDSICEITANDG